MAIQGYTESTLATSEVFNSMEEIMHNKEKAIKLIKEAKHLINQDIEAAYVAVKQISDTLTRAALKAFDNEETVLIYNHLPDQAVSQILPFITFKMKDTYRTFVFVDKYITVSRDGVLTISPAVLRDLLTGAVIATGIKKNYMNLANDQYLAKILMEIYTELCCRIINREYSIMTDKPVYNKVRYWFNRFFLEKIFGINDTPENIEALSKAHINFLDEFGLQELTNSYNDKAPNNISDVLDGVKNITPRMNTLSLGTFLGNWTNYYFIPATLAIDNIEYLIFMVNALLSGNNIINIGASDIVKEAKNIKSFKPELIKLIE